MGTHMQAALCGRLFGLWKAVPTCAHMNGKLHVCVTVSEKLWISIFSTGRLCVGVKRRLCILVSLWLGD